MGERVGAPKGAPTRFRDMPPLEYVAGNVANVLNTSHWASESHRISKQAAAEGMVNALRLPDERKKEAARVLYEATHGPPDGDTAAGAHATARAPADPEEEGRGRQQPAARKGTGAPRPHTNRKDARAREERERERDATSGQRVSSTEHYCALADALWRQSKPN